MSKIKKDDNFYLIDGSGYIFRAYYALPPLTRKSDGLPVGWDKPIFKLGLLPFVYAEILKILLLTLIVNKLKNFRRFI